ncbi:hypothetical protein TSUD_100000 [Trifolium subterraneum]|uniref:RNase H type-1 domain-containing protein n=1 Tax=Trifolium subterraneum TaxID=3900 RepID=A0A2Z6NLD2_TRISU|nr:hypothetical protein TSUD_100000 [Trifolium subterraneum]
MILGREDMCVHDLIEEGGREWRRSLIMGSFNERDARCILSTPLFGDMQEDVPSWKHSRNELLSQHKIILFVAAFWCIWKRRNQKIWEDIELHPSVSLQLASDIIYQWKIAQTSHQRQQTSAAILPHSAATRNASGEERSVSVTTSAVRVIWTPPVQGMLKCNVDAAIFKEQNCFGAGMCLRDDKGNFIRAQTTWNYGNLLPYDAEAWGLKAAISWLRNLGYVNVVIELDCKLVVDGISEHRVDQESRAPAKEVRGGKINEGGEQRRKNRVLKNNTIVQIENEDKELKQAIIY